jgi:hypothetical protein
LHGRYLIATIRVGRGLSTKVRSEAEGYLYCPFSLTNIMIIWLFAVKILGGGLLFNRKDIW